MQKRNRMGRMIRINGNRLPSPILYILPILLLRGLCVKRKGGSDDALKSFEPCDAFAV